MLNTLLSLFAILIIIIATLFSIIGVLGYRKFPDVYTRLHATGKVGTLGVVLLLLATAIILPGTWSRSLLLALFLLVAGPVSSHVLSSAAYRLNIPMKKAVLEEPILARIDS